MKMLFLSFAILLSVLTANAQGINFFTGSWSEAVSKARAEQKFIFVDQYATWCGPCKLLSANVFTDPEVGDFFNANFISVKMDMEHPKNAEFALNYPVSLYPTLIFINPYDRKIVLKKTGYLSPEALINFAQRL